MPFQLSYERKKPRVGPLRTMDKIVDVVLAVFVLTVFGACAFFIIR
jgi:hypothetical protein